MKMLPDMDRRLENWRRYVWMMRDGGGNFARASMDEVRVDGEGWDAPTVISTNDHEAEETAKGVLALRGELRAAVEAWYLRGGGRASKALFLCVSETTLFERVCMGHRALATWLSDKAILARPERERVVAVQAAARVGVAPRVHKLQK